jgi:DNA-binding XRE family transcriptional regulator
MTQRMQRDIKTYRLKHRVEATAIARWAGISPTTLYMWEASQHPPIYGVRLYESYIDKFRRGQEGAR